MKPNVRESMLQIVAILVFFGFLCQFYSAPLTGDFKVYLATAMEMREKGEWLRPILYGSSSYFKPPFQYWMTLMGWRVFGFGNFGAYFPSVLALSATIILISWVSHFFKKQSRFFSLPTAGLWFAANIASMCYGVVTQMEVWVALFSMLTGILMLKSFDRPQGLFRREWLVAFFFVAGVSAWVKSPVYTALSYGSLWLFLVLTRNWRVFRSGEFYLLHGLGCLVAASWFLWAWRVDGDAFLNHYFLKESLNKTAGNGVSALRMLYDFTTQCVPLSGLLWCLPGVVWNQFYAGFRFAPTLRRACIQALDLLRVPKNAWILAQLLPALVFFLGFPYRLEAYLYVCLPYWALLMEWGLPRSRGSAWVAGVSGIFFGSVFFLISVILTLSGMLAWSVGVLIAVASVVLVGVAVEFFRPHRSVHLGGDFSSQFKSAVRWQRFAWGAFFLVVAIRAGATSLGERDISFFRQFMGQHSQVGLGVYDARRDIWHERPALGVAVHKYSHALLDPQAAVDWLSSGGVVVFDDTYVEGDLLKVRSLLDKKKAQGVAMEVHEVAWRRSRRALFLPSWEAIKKLVSRNDRSGSQEWTKEYRILYR